MEEQKEMGSHHQRLSGNQRVSSARLERQVLKALRKDETLTL